MKKIIALLLVLGTLCSMAVACAKPSETTGEPSESKSPSAQQPSQGGSSAANVDPNKVTTVFDDLKLYEIKASDGTVLQRNFREIKEAKDWEGTVWSIGTVKRQGGETVSVFYAGDKMQEGLEAKRLLSDGDVVVGGVIACDPGSKQGWYIRDNGNGTYKIVSAGNPKFSLSCKNGKFSMQLDETNETTFTITEVENKNIGTKYSQYVSQKKNIIVRLPADVVDQVYERVKSGYQGKESEESLKGRIADRMQLFAESVQKIYDSYIDLTAYVPYPRIIVYAYEHQDVMAGVVGGDNNIYVNVDWYVDDMEKMWKRWEDGKEDYNFCILHEMGHMFDWNRGWTFESEMQADLKATYVLYSHKDDKYGAWAAPAEYPWNSVWNIETIDTKGYNGLSGSMSYRKTGDKVTYQYNIYRCAEMYTAYIKHCEATDGLKGFEAMKQTFHWFQENGYTSSSFTGAEKIKTFNEKLTEYTGMDIDKFMTEYCKRSKADWQAPFAKAEGLPEK